jgi:isoleucyl-tRNA synthetase
LDSGRSRQGHVYVEDIRIFDELLDRLGEAYRKIRNTCRFMLGNLSNQQDPKHPRFDPERDLLPYRDMLEIDRWALARKEQLLKKCRKHYEDYQFHQVYSALYYFCTVDMSAFYLDILKDRLYTHPTHSPSRRSAQSALWEILDALTRLMAPMLPFTSEEVYQALYEDRPQARADSIHALLFPESKSLPDGEQLLEEWEKLRNIRESVLKALENVRQQGTIGNSLEAKVRIRAAGATRALLRRHEPDLRYIFIVSEVQLEEGREESLDIEVLKADGAKCERCWNYSVAVGKDAVYPTLCERCVPVMRTL